MSMLCFSILSTVRPSGLPAESPILQRDRTYLSKTPSKPIAQANVPNRRRTLSDYRTAENSNAGTEQNGKTAAAKTSASGPKLLSKRMVGIYHNGKC